MVKKPYRIPGLDRLSAEDLSSRVSHLTWREFREDSTIPQIAWLGHASFLIVWRGRRILLDPVFSRLIGFAPRRCLFMQNGQHLQPDSIFLSHAHMDHMNTRTLSGFGDTDIYLPEGSERLLSTKLRSKSIPVQAGATLDLGPLRVHTVPARHGGWRYPWQKGYQAFGYVINDGAKSVYYAGDTAYGSHFKEIGTSFHVNKAMLPIGAYAPRWFLKSRHLNPEEAVMAFKDLGAKQMIPFHFGTYRLSWEALSEPLPRFAKCARDSSCDWYLPIGV